MAAIRRLQANPELGEFRIHAALSSWGSTSLPGPAAASWRLHRALGAPHPAAAMPHEPQPMPFAAVRRHQYWSVDVRYIEDHDLGTSKPAYAISILENFSRALLASAISPRQDLTAYLIVLRAAIETHGAPEGLVSDSGSIFKANQARAIYAALGIQKEQIDAGTALAELHRDPLQRHAAHGGLPLRASHDLGRVAGRPRALLPRLQPPGALRPSGATVGRRSPAAVLGWVQGAWCDPADLDRLFRLRAIRSITAGGSIRFRHWRLYAERGLAGARAAVWVHGETLTMEYGTETLAQYWVAFEADGHRLREVAEPRFFATDHASPQPFLVPLDEVEWQPCQQLAPYRPRRSRADDGEQPPLFTLAAESATG